MNTTIKNIEQVTGIPLETIASKNRTVVVSDARSILTWELMLQGIPMEDIAKLINKSLTTAYQLTYKYRDKRKHGEFKKTAEMVAKLRS